MSNPYLRVQGKINFIAYTDYNTEVIQEFIKKALMDLNMTGAIKMTVEIPKIDIDCVELRK